MKETRQGRCEQQTMVHQNQNQSDTVSVTITVGLLWSFHEAAAVFKHNQTDCLVSLSCCSSAASPAVCQ